VSLDMQCDNKRMKIRTSLSGLTCTVCESELNIRRGENFYSLQVSLYRGSTVLFHWTALLSLVRCNLASASCAGRKTNVGHVPPNLVYVPSSPGSCDVRVRGARSACVKRNRQWSVPRQVVATVAILNGLANVLGPFLLKATVIRSGFSDS